MCPCTSVPVGGGPEKNKTNRRITAGYTYQYCALEC